MRDYLEKGWCFGGEIHSQCRSFIHTHFPDGSDDPSYMEMQLGVDSEWGGLSCNALILSDSGSAVFVFDLTF